MGALRTLRWLDETIRVWREARDALLASVVPDAPRSRPPLRLGVDALDDLIGGGLPLGRLLEVGGAPGAGKTALALAFARRSLQAGRNVLWLDADGTFRWPKQWAAPGGLLVSPSMPLDAARDLVALAMTRHVGTVVIDALDALDTGEAWGDDSLLRRRAKIEHTVRAWHKVSAQTGARVVLVRHGYRGVHAPVSIYAPTRLLVEAPRSNGLAAPNANARIRIRALRVRARESDRVVAVSRRALLGAGAMTEDVA